MSKLILLLLLGLLVYLVFRGVRGASQPRRGRTAQPPAAERMVACARCGVHLPESEALAAGGRHYCSEEHRRLGAA